MYIPNIKGCSGCKTRSNQFFLFTEEKIFSVAFTNDQLIYIS